jgi:hypothetical protein
MNSNIKKVKSRYQEKIQNAICGMGKRVDKGHCIICGKEAKNGHYYNSTVDYLADADLISDAEFSDFAEDEAGSGWDTVLIGNDCIKKIIEVCN